MEKKKRSNTVVVRLSDEELAALNRDVALTGCSREQYLRLTMMMYRPKAKPPADFAGVLRELSRIGNNLNQIARKANETGAIDAEDYWRNAAELQEVTSRLIREVTAPVREKNTPEGKEVTD